MDLFACRQTIENYGEKRNNEGNNRSLLIRFSTERSRTRPSIGRALAQMNPLFLVKLLDLRYWSVEKIQ
jgi:hypothetical protein